MPRPDSDHDQVGFLVFCCIDHFWLRRKFRDMGPQETENEPDVSELGTDISELGTWDNQSKSYNRPECLGTHVFLAKYTLETPGQHFT